MLGDFILKVLKILGFIIFTVAFGIIGLVSDLTSLGFENPKTHFEHFIKFIFENILYLFLFSMFIWKLRIERVLTTNPCKRIGLIIFFKNLAPYKALKLIFELHQLEHKMISKSKILKENYKFNKDNAYFAETENKLLKDILTNILEDYQKIFNLVSRNVSVNFKRFIDDSTLETFVRIPSRKEILNASLENEQAEKARTLKELFKVSNETNIENLKFTSKEEKNFSVNSAYNNVLYKENKYWICNNLKKATEKGTFFSTSKNYVAYYNSLVVFAVCDKVITGKDIKDLTMGLLIFDSNSNSFEHKITKELGGYLTHKLYNFLYNENIHYSYHSSYKEKILNN